MRFWRRDPKYAGKHSYSQCGEDRIVAFALAEMHITQPIYLDLGAHHPVYINNTYHFYMAGSRGICVEPNPRYARMIEQKRPLDTCLAAGIGPESQPAREFYVFDEDSLCTFSSEFKDELLANSNKRLVEVASIPIYGINAVLREHCPACPHFVSLDIEGLDYEILRAFDFAHFRPQVFCVETISYSEQRNETKNTPLIEFLCEQGYFVYADTYINTIFVDTAAWRSR